ncbi:acyltransferase family protein [Aestuariispira ectoiniformans]|uniref:acyltransferase family protein n=1 Tax=Aestuariispira ectoiniformans TaxID=2775080 RepID=UPI00223C23D6|nr:acyltransferase [Aestuariispira ectoiniformans]
MQGEKILYLESLRGLAAIAVTLFHAHFAINSPLANNTFVANSDLMVDFFFVLSGFVIAYNYETKITCFKSLCIFQAKRFLRLYPLHFVTLILFLFIELAKYAFEQKTGIKAYNAAFSSNDLGAFLNNIFLTQALFEQNLTFNTPSWSISTEFYTYAVFGILLILFQSRRSKIIVNALIIVTAAITLHITNTAGAMTGFAIIRCIYAFYLGYVVYLVGRRLAPKIPGSVGTILLIGSAVAVTFKGDFPLILFPLLFSATILALFRSGPTLPKAILCNRQLVFLGTISYGIYMWHNFAWWTITQILRFVLHFPIAKNPETGKDFLNVDAVTSSIMIVVGLIVVLILSWLSYKYIERPINDLRHHLKGDRKAADLKAGTT